MVGETIVEWHHAHVDAGHDCHTRRLFLSGGDAPGGYKFLDVLPIRNDETFESEFAAKNVSQDLTVDVTWDAVDLRGVDHDRARACFDGSVESRKKIFAQVVFRN